MRTIADLNLISRYLQSNFSKILSIITDIKESGTEVTLCESWQVARCAAGNSFYRAGDHAKATTKYRKVSSPHISASKSSIPRFVIGSLTQLS